MDLETLITDLRRAGVRAVRIELELGPAWPAGIDGEPFSGDQLRGPLRPDPSPATVPADQAPRPPQGDANAQAESPDAHSADTDAEQQERDPDLDLELAHLPG